MLIADSGSSKTDWALIRGNSLITRQQTIGFNPYFHSSEQIQEEIEKNLLPSLARKGESVDKIFYYGSGCSTSDKCKIVTLALSNAFQITDAYVDHDLLAAARALCGVKPGIAAILGTGSNSCLFDGRRIVENVPSVGYLWSDYGGGSQIGKFIIRDYFEGEMPADIKAAFELAGYNREMILDAVYKGGVPSKFLASVSLFAFQHKQHPFIVKVLEECFSSFFEKQVSKYTGSKSYRINAVGSIAYFYQDQLTDCAKNQGFEMGTILRSPMEGLIAYHANNL